MQVHAYIITDRMDVVWELEADLEMFMRAYMDRMTPDFVNLSIGLRAPQLYEDTKQLIMKVPQHASTCLHHNRSYGESQGSDTIIDTLMPFSYDSSVSQHS